MYTTKALVVAFLAGVIVAGGMTFVLTRPANPAQSAAAVCPRVPAAMPATTPSKAWEYSEPAPTTGGVRPTELQNHPRPIGSGH